MKRQQGRVQGNGRVSALRKGSDSLRNEPVPLSQPTKICSLGRRLEMRPGGRGAGMKTSTTQVGVSSAGGLLGDLRMQISAGSYNPLVPSSVGTHCFLCSVVHHHPPNLFYCLLHYLAVLPRLILRGPSSSVFQVAGIAGIYHCAQIGTYFDMYQQAFVFVSGVHIPHDAIRPEALGLTQAGDPYVRCAPGSAVPLTEAAVPSQMVMQMLSLQGRR